MAKIEINADRCKGCGLCTHACPKNIIALSKTTLNSKGYRPAEFLSEEKCIGCAMCATMCPDVAITVYK